MKKVLLLILVITAVLGCSACSNGGCDHNFVIDPGKPATCTEVGMTQGQHCSKCGEILVVQEQLAKSDHVAVTDSAVEASCVREGKTAGTHCRDCGTVLTAQQNINKAGHRYASGGKCSTCAVQLEIHDNSNIYSYYNRQISAASNGYVSFMVYGRYGNSRNNMNNQKIVGFDSDGRETFSSVVPTYAGGYDAIRIEYDKVPSTTVKITISDFYA